MAVVLVIFSEILNELHDLIRQSDRRALIESKIIDLSHCYWKSEIKMKYLSNGKSFPSRTCDRDFRQDQEKATPLPTGKPEGLSAAVQWSRQIEQAFFALYNKQSGESNLPARKEASEMAVKHVTVRANQLLASMKVTSLEPVRLLLELQ